MSICQDVHSSQSIERVYTLVLNKEGNVLICQTEANYTGHAWSMLMTSLPGGCDPVQAARQALYDLGYESQHWVYLGSYVGMEKQAVHFLFARNAYRVYTSPLYGNGYRWVSPHDLRYALLDGRVTKVGDATTIALAMYLMEPLKVCDTAVSRTNPLSINSIILTDA